MIYGFIFATLLLMAVMSGTAFFQVVGGLPVLGPVVLWWGEFVGPIGEGMGANLVHALLTAQVIVLALAVVLNGPAWTIKAVAWALRVYRSTKPPERSNALAIVRPDQTDETPPAQNEQRLPSVDASWVEQAYPLQQITINIQGTRHTKRDDLISQLETVLTRLRSGDCAGEDHDDDFGYRFVVEARAQGPSFFDLPAGFR